MVGQQRSSMKKLMAALVVSAWCGFATGEAAPGCCALTVGGLKVDNPCSLLGPPSFNLIQGLGQSVLCCRGPATSNCTGTSTGGPFIYRGTVSFDGVNFDCGNLPVCPRPTEPPVPAGVPFPHAGTGCTVPASTRCPVSVLSPDVSTATLGDTSACCYAGSSSATCSIINGVVSGSYTCGATTVPCDKIPSCTSRAPATPTVSPSAGAGLAPAMLAVLSAALLALL
jgi:hypothetical protein